MDRTVPPPFPRSTFVGMPPRSGEGAAARMAPAFAPEELAAHRVLLERMAAGEAEALRRLVDETGNRIQGVIQRILRDPEAVREVVQDTFLKAWRQAGDYRPERGEVISWLVFMGRNLAIDRLRRQNSQRSLLERLSAERTEPEPVPQDTFVQREALAAGLSRLAVPQRRALELAFFEGCTQAEIAAALHTPIGNVKNHLSRGLRKLREIFPAHE